MKCQRITAVTIQKRNFWPVFKLRIQSDNSENFGNKDLSLI